MADRRSMAAVGPRRVLAQRLVWVTVFTAVTLFGCSKERSGQLPGPQMTELGVLFQFHDPTARSVQLMGDWPGNQWGQATAEIDSSRIGIMTQTENGVWQRYEKLSQGTYMYKFKIDGHIWKEDPNNSQRVADGYGGFNSVVSVTPTSK